MQRPHVHYPVQLPHTSAASEYAIPSQPPSRNASYTSLDQLGYYIPDRLVRPSPTASFISLPETEYDHTLRHLRLQSYHGTNAIQ